MTGKKKILAKDFKNYISLIPDDVEIWIGIGEFQSPIVDILKDIKENRVIIVNQTYIDDCIANEEGLEWIVLNVNTGNGTYGVGKDMKKCYIVLTVH